MIGYEVPMGVLYASLNINFGANNVTADRFSMKLWMNYLTLVQQSSIFWESKKVLSVNISRLKKKNSHFP